MNHPKIVYITAVARSMRILAGLPTYLRVRGFEPHVISSPDEKLRSFCDGEGCVVHPVPISRSITPLRDVVSVFRLWQTLRRIRPQIVDSHMSKAGLLGMTAAWLAGVPLRIYTNHGVAFSSAKGLRRFVFKTAERLTCRLATHVHCVSHSVRALIVAEGCCKEDKIRVLASGSCGIDTQARFNPERMTAELRRQTLQACGIPTRAPVLGFVGRIAALKGLDDLGIAWQTLRRKFPDLHLLIVGEVDTRCPMRPETDAMFRSDPRVHFAGTVADPGPYYGVMDVLTLPSFHEGLPATVLEGAAMQVPTVASRVPGNVDAVEDGVTGTLIPAHDAQALAEAIDAYFANPDLRRKHALAGRQRVLRSFRLEVFREAVYQRHLELLRQKGISVPHPTQATTPDQGAETTVSQTPRQRRAA